MPDVFCLNKDDYDDADDVMIRLCQFTGVGSSTEKGGRRELKVREAGEVAPCLKRTPVKQADVI